MVFNIDWEHWQLHLAPATIYLAFDDKKHVVLLADLSTRKIGNDAQALTLWVTVLLTYFWKGLYWSWQWKKKQLSMWNWAKKKRETLFWIAGWHECWHISKGYEVCPSQWSVALRGCRTMSHDHTGYHLAWPHIIAIQYFAEPGSKSYFFKTALINRHFQSSLRFPENI